MLLQIRIGIILCVFSAVMGCTSAGGDGASGTTSPRTLAIEFTRLTTATPNPFQVKVTILQDGQPVVGEMPAVSLGKGTRGDITDQGDGSYIFTVTPTATGTHSVSITSGMAVIRRSAVVLDTYGTGVGQPLAIPGTSVNSIGYEDGATITPDGEYLFIQYGPWYFSGLGYLNTICASGSYSLGYDLNTCDGRANSSLVFNTVGPLAAPMRPDFPLGGISNSKLTHIPSLLIPGVANGIVGFPTVFYGFRKQSDGTFAEPFKVAFNDERGLNGPYGLTFRMKGDGTADFAVAWFNYFDDLGGDEKPNIYSGTLTLGESKNLGNVTYSGELYSAINPLITPVTFASHTGVQGNPSFGIDTNNEVKSIWTDDEQATHDLTVYRITAGTYPTGTWAKDTLPSVINTAGDEKQPYFTGTDLILSRENQIVKHTYRPANGACANTYTHNDCWAPEEIWLKANGHTAPGEIFGVGEPTIATVNGERLLYFVYVQSRTNPSVSGAIIDYDINVAYVPVP